MRRQSIAAFLALAFASVAARASICRSAANTRTPHRIVDHYLYDASLRQEWAVLVDCDHPEKPPQIELVAVAPRAAAQPENPLAIRIRAGATVEVLSPPNAAAAIRLTGTAMQTAFAGQPIRVSLNPSGRFITGLVCGPHSVELGAAEKGHWSQR